MSDEPRVFALGGNGSTLAVVNSLRPTEATGKSPIVTAHLIPLARTPAGVVVGEGWQNAGIALGGLFDWIDRTFPPEDEDAFVAPPRDVELLVRIGWEAPLPERVDEAAVLNIDDVPEDVVDGLAQPSAPLVQCAACRRLCVRDEFVWKEKQLCAWDYHVQVFGKRGPWRNGAYEERHYETLPQCAYVVPPLLASTDVELVCSLSRVADATARTIIDTLLVADAGRAHLAVRLPEEGFVVLRESGERGSA